MIRKASSSDAGAVAALALKLWPEHELRELRLEFSQLLSGDSAAVFLCFREGEAVGFAQCQLRRDYVEGTESSPVGYLEGIYVEPEFRGCGISGQLLSACENWARSMGCREFASDCELDNQASLIFHLRSGFREANRIVCFVKEM